MERRTFLVGGLAASMAATVPGQSARAQAGTVGRLIPSTDQRIPAVGLGTWITFNVGADPVLLEECAAVMADFLDEGGGMIDSSPMYGSSQNTIGYGLDRLGSPAGVFSADKVWTGSVPEGALGHPD